MAAAAPPAGPRLPEFPRTPPPGSSRPRAAGGAQSDALRLPVCRRRARGRADRRGDPGPSPPHNDTARAPEPASCRPAGPGVRSAPLRPRQAARAHRPRSRLQRRQPRLAVRRSPPSAAARRDDVVAAALAAPRGPADWLALPGAPRRPASQRAERSHWLAACVVLAAGDSRAPGSEPAARARAMERLQGVRAQLQAWERAFRRRHGRRPDQVRAGRGAGRGGRGPG